MLDSRTYINRELSGLSSIRRMLEEAKEETVLCSIASGLSAIFSSNLDEFFMVRVRASSV
ncbi:MAG TPA: hypothetical protein VF452_09840 [Candidatus Binatia bacterium]